MIRKFTGLVLLLSIISVRLIAQDDQTADCPKLQSKKAIKTFDEAMNLFSEKHFSEAVPLFKEVISIEPTTAEPYFYLGFYNFKFAQNYAASENYLKKAIEICPDVDIYAYYFLADICYGREEWAKAKDYLTKFLSDPALIDNDVDLVRAREMLKWAKTYVDIYTKPVPFDPHYLPGVCSPLSEYMPSFSPDGEIVFYTRLIEMPPRKDDIFQKKYMKECLYASRMKDNKYDSGAEMPYPFNKTDNIGGVTVTIDNKTLYVAVGNYDAMGYMEVDIYYSTMDASGYWSSLDTVPGINMKKCWDTQPSVSSDGKTLYFVSDRPGGFGYADIWMSNKGADGKWSKPVNLGPAINTKGDEKTPFIHTDSQTLYFTSGDAVDGDGNVLGMGHAGLGGLDIFYSRLGADGKWSMPKNIGYPINTAKDESGFIVSTNGKTGYFCSNKLDGPGGYDVYGFDLYNEARPEEVLLVKGEVKQEGSDQPVRAKVELKNVVTKKITEIPVDSVDGKYIAALVFKNDYVLTVKTDDFAYESKYLTKADSVPEEKIKVDFEVKKIEVGQSYRLNDIFFPTNSAELTKESCTVLDGFIDFLNDKQTIKVAIEGHTDDVGKAEDNLILSDNRAKSVYEYLISKGIDAGRLSYKGFGESKPVADNTTPDGRARNRRTEFVIVEK